MRSKHTFQRPPRRDQLPGLARGSCSWLDAVGTGYAVGPTDAVLRHAATAARHGYCR